MGRKIVCALLVCLVSPAAADITQQADVLPELSTNKTSFAYRVRHSVHPLSNATLGGPAIRGSSLPWIPVAELATDIVAGAVRQSPGRIALCSHAVSVAEAHKLPAPFFANLIQQESGFKAHVVSPVGAQGIAQFMPRVARAYGLENPFDPLHSMAVSARFLSELLAQFGNLGLAAAAYNAGPRRVQDWLSKRGRLPEETRTYVRNITGQPAERWARVNAPTQTALLPAHARCPQLPLVQVHVPEASSIKIAKAGSPKIQTSMAVAVGKLREAEERQRPRKSAAVRDQNVAVSNTGSTKITVSEERSKDLMKVSAKKTKDSNDTVRKIEVAKLGAWRGKPPAAKRLKIAAAR